MEFLGVHSAVITGTRNDVNAVQEFVSGRSDCGSAIWILHLPRRAVLSFALGPERESDGLHEETGRIEEPLLQIRESVFCVLKVWQKREFDFGDFRHVDIGPASEVLNGFT